MSVVEGKGERFVPQMSATQGGRSMRHDKDEFLWLVVDTIVAVSFCQRSDKFLRLTGRLDYRSDQLLPSWRSEFIGPSRKIPVVSGLRCQVEYMSKLIIA